MNFILENDLIFNKKTKKKKFYQNFREAYEDVCPNFREAYEDVCPNFVLITE